jgi:hypothetical protein
MVVPEYPDSWYIICRKNCGLDDLSTRVITATSLSDAGRGINRTEGE